MSVRPAVSRGVRGFPLLIGLGVPWRELELAECQPGHPESADRVPAILEALEAAGLTPEERGADLMELVDFSSASAEDVTRVRARARRRSPCSALHDHTRRPTPMDRWTV